MHVLALSYGLFDPYDCFSFFLLFPFLVVFMICLKALVVLQMMGLAILLPFVGIMVGK